MRTGAKILLGVSGLAAGAVITARLLWKKSESKEKTSPANVQAGPQKAAVIKQAAEIVGQAASELGMKLTPGELMFVLTVSELESSYGRGWKGAMTGSNNWGAVQCTKNDSSCADYSDSYSDGTRYDQKFRVYSSPVEGAKDVIKHVLINRPQVKEAIASNSMGAISIAMRRTTYYGGWCPEAVKKHGPGKGYNKEQRNPVSEAAKDCEIEAAKMYAKRASSIASKISSVLEIPQFED